MPEQNNFFITTAIDYVNALPHLGTAYEKIGADVMARFQRLRGRSVFFLMGVDEHSVNVEKEAQRRNIPVQKYCDELAGQFEGVWKALNISYDFFIRTSSPQHVRAVQHIFQVIYQKGDIYLGHYEGWYCNSCEAYLRDQELAEGNCPVHKKPPEWIREENYFFALSRYQEGLKRMLETMPGFLQPKIRYNEIANVIKGGLEDISVSRTGARWGIPLPFDDKAVVYVWFDALINYISALGYPDDMKRFSEWWPARVHVIGKDITRFHCVIWPAMLMSLGVELPQMVFGHGFVYLKGEKMSKTTGTLIGPVEAAQKFGPDALRYFLMREIPFDRDGDFTWDAFKMRYQADLANDLGNLIQRVLSMIQRYFTGTLPRMGKLEGVDNDLVEAFKGSFEIYVQSMERFAMSEALVEMWSFIQKCNGYVGRTAPWTLAKKPDQRERLSSVLNLLCQCIFKIAVLINPFMPAVSVRILGQLGVSGAAQNIDYELCENWNFLRAETKLGSIEPIFPKVDD